MRFDSNIHQFVSALIPASRRRTYLYYSTNTKLTGNPVRNRASNGVNRKTRLVPDSSIDV